MLIHCAAGKDRTGILAALTHHLVGVHPDDIVEDYLLTNSAYNFEQRLPLMADYIAREVGRPLQLAAVRTAMGVHADYLASAFAAIIARYGSIDAYLRDALGVDAAHRARVEARLAA